MAQVKTLAIAVALLGLAACSRQESTPTPTMGRAADAAPALEHSQPLPADVPAGDYALDKSHASLLFRVSHMGFSGYTARFRRFDARLAFDPVNLPGSNVTATIDPTSIETDYPDPAQLDFNAQLQSGPWLNTAQFKEMTFRSTRVEIESPNRMKIEGELTMRGATRPVTLAATLNGGYAGFQMDPHARIGFSARGTLKRSQFGMSFGIPEPGSNMGVGDTVEIIIETEFTGPAWRGATTSQ
jgi:polyisoprenoid-binding protein YceI